MAVCVMHELDPTGDTKVTWDSDNPEEVEAARQTFNRLVNPPAGARGKRYAAFHVKEDGSQGKQMREFDANAEKIILVPQIAGG